MEKHSEVFVASDVAKKKHAVAIAEGGRQGEVRFVGDVENSPLPIEKTIKRLATRYGQLHVCFEAGPTGYGLYRQVKALGHDCMVVAPALIPKRAGERIKTNRCRFRFQCETGGVRELRALGEMSPAAFSVSIETGSAFFRFQLGLIDHLIDRTMNPCRGASKTQMIPVGLRLSAALFSYAGC